jgi:Fibrobacter succinogenes major domain (Fib_succ_major).
MKKAFLVPFFTMFVLAACGDDDSSSSVDEGGASGGIASVATYDDLAHCTKSHYGEVVYVEDEDTYFECTSDDWTEVDSAAVDSILATTSSSSAAEDSVKSSSSIKADSSETADVETVKVDSVTVSGFAQKGPFESGATVTVYGLDSLLEKTKTKFSGKVTGDSGAFSVSKVVLPSQYALVEVNGFYMNENSGKKTSGTKLTLGALVDLSEGKSVKANVNVFTELEYARAKRLVLKEKFNVPAAKKRATKELLSVFGGTGGDDLTSTSLSLSDTNSAGRALLAAGILLQGELSASKFGSMLAEVADLFAAKGSLDSAELRADLADWASRADSTDAYASIRANVKSFKLAAAVPDFENFLYGFWTAEYKLGACTDSLEETIKKNENKLSDNYGVGYACTAKRWHKATALDTDLGLCTGKMEGTFKEYKGGRETEYYVCKSGTWNKITATQYELKECTESIELKYVATKSKEYFVCTDKQWVAIDSITYELKLCTDKRDKELAKTAKGASYVCQWDGEEGSWRKPTDIEAELGVCGGKTVKADSVYKTKSGDYYACEAGEWKKADEAAYLFGNCTAALEDTVRWSGEFAKDEDGKPYGYGNIPVDTAGVTGKYYECHESRWNESNVGKYVYGVKCVENTIRGLMDGGAMSKFIEVKTVDGTVSAKNIVDGLAYMIIVGSALARDSLVYVQCKNGVWKGVDESLYVTGRECSAEIDSTIVKGFSCVHEGSNYYWREATDAEKANGAFCSATLNDGELHNGYVCDKNGNVYFWRELSAAESANNALCTAALDDRTIHNGYVCEKNGDVYAWRDLTEPERANNALCTGAMNDGLVHKGYVCEIGEGWRAATTAEKATGKVCNTSNGNTEIVNGYVCQYLDTNWRKASDVEIETDTVCGMLTDVIYHTGSGPVIRQVTTYDDRLFAGKYVCSQEGPCLSNKIGGYCWRSATSSEKSLGQPCIGEMNKLFIKKSGDMYRCSGPETHNWSKWAFSTITDNRDGMTTTYRTVDIRDTTVMVDNLKFRHTDDYGANWICDDDIESNCDRYGTRYSWDAAVALQGVNESSDKKIQGACPNGWHVPNSVEGKWLQGKLEGKYGFPQYLEGEGYDPEPTPRIWWTSKRTSNASSNTAFAYEFGKTELSGRTRNNAYYIRCIKDY